MNYYNEFEPKAAAGLRQLIIDGFLPAGEVDTRSIIDVRSSDLKGFTQCHFFAGIGGWPRALQLAGWPVDRPVWTGSPPCQSFSVAGKRKGGADDRDLWPTWFNLIRECRPPSIYGEQVAGAIPHGWLDRVFIDMESENYAIASAVLPAAGVNAPHKRDRLGFVAHSIGGQLSEPWWRSEARNGTRSAGEEILVADPAGGIDGRISARSSIGTLERFDGQSPLDNASGIRRGARRQDDACHDRLFLDAAGGERGGIVEVAGCPRGAAGISAPSCGREGITDQPLDGSHERSRNFWADSQWLLCADGKARRIPATDTGICLLAHGIPERVGLLRAGGNAIVPEQWARFIEATM